MMKLVINSITFFHAYKELSMEAKFVSKEGLLMEISPSMLLEYKDGSDQESFKFVY